MRLLDVTISRSAVAFAAALLLLSCAPGPNGASGPPGAHGMHDEHVSAGVPFTDDRTIVQVVTTNVGGKNFFVPSTIVLTAGSGRSLSFFNTTDQPHGLKIPALGIEVVLMPLVETKVDLPPLEGGHIYAVQCHLHPPHREAALVVLPAAK